MGTFSPAAAGITKDPGGLFHGTAHKFNRQTKPSLFVVVVVQENQGAIHLMMHC